MTISAPGGVGSIRPSEVESFLDAGACLELLGNLYPLSVSMLYFQLESFMKRLDVESPAGETSLPRRLLEYNRSPEHRLRPDGKLELLDLGFDVLVTHDSKDQSTSIEMVPGRFAGPAGVWLRVLLLGDDKIDRLISVPLQTLMPDWGSLAGYQGFRHTLGFRSPDGMLIEEWHYIGVADRAWLGQMDEHDQAVRAGTNRKFSAAWRTYVGAAHLVMASELVRVGATEDAILEWEEAEVDRCLEAGNCLNLAPGGLKGMRFLYAEGATPRERVPISERVAALESWAHRPDSAPHVASVPHMLGVQWQDNGFHLKHAAAQGKRLTPNQVIEIQRLAGDRKDPVIVAAAVGSNDVELVRRVMGGEVQDRVFRSAESSGL